MTNVCSSDMLARYFIAMRNWALFSMRASGQEGGGGGSGVIVRRSWNHGNAIPAVLTA